MTSEPTKKVGSYGQNQPPGQMIMNTIELYRLTDWIEHAIVNAGVVEHYQSLHQVLQQQVQASQPRQPFARQRDQLLACLSRVPVEQLSRQQRQLLDDLGIAQAVGEQGVAQVEDTLYRNAIDLVTSAQVIGELLQHLQDGIRRSSQIRSGLQGVVDNDARRATEDPVLMRVLFAGQSSMANVTDFRRWGDLWHDIGHGIAFAHGERAEDVKIVGASSGSVVLELAVSINFASTASDIILGALQLTHKVQDINQKAEELRRLQLKNNRLILDLEREAEYETRTGVENISAVMIKKLGLKKNGEGDKITALMKAVKHLIYFMDNGGEVDFVIDDSEQSQQHDAEFDALRNTFQHIHQLEKKLANSATGNNITRAA